MYNGNDVFSYILKAGLDGNISMADLNSGLKITLETSYAFAQDLVI